MNIFMSPWYNKYFRILDFKVNAIEIYEVQEYYQEENLLS